MLNIEVQHACIIVYVNCTCRSTRPSHMCLLAQIYAEHSLLHTVGIICVCKLQIDDINTYFNQLDVKY